MAHKKDKNEPERNTGRMSGRADPGREFDDAVTTEIPEVLAEALEGDHAADLEDILITDMHLNVHAGPEEDDALPAGFVLNDRFEIIELIHSGGMGHVYKAVDHRRHQDSSPDIHVAIKMMRPAVASDQEARFALEREAAKAQKLSHPNIINIFDFDCHEDRFFLVMQWLEGESVNSLLRRNSGQRLASSFAWPVIEGAAAAVQYAHENGVVHADINPSNIFITDSQDIKLLDFGVARYLSTSGQIEEDRFTWVTQTYASPEVLAGLPPVFEDDVFSLACVAYRLLSGRHPFGGAPSLVAKHRGVTVEPIPGLPDNEWQFLRRALSYERSERPGSASEFIDQHAVASSAAATAGPRGRVARAFRLPLAIAAALIVVAAGLWLLRPVIEGELAPFTEPPVAGESAAAVAPGVPPVSLIGEFTSAAAQALDRGLLVEPNEANARALYREALVLEPNNPEALRGLRTISNALLQDARDALNADDPRGAYAALTVAFETDPANPAIEIVSELLAVKGDAELAGARLAAISGDYEQATSDLSSAELYEHVDAVEIQSLRRQIATGLQDDQLLASLATADAHIVAGRLIQPAGENAHELLTLLHQQHGDDARLLATKERLGERLLTRAAFAAAASRVPEAAELLDAIDGLGVLVAEVEAARASLAETTVVEQTVSPPDETPQASLAAATPPIDNEPSMPPEPVPDSAAADPEPALQRKTVQEFGIERYVAPRFPRRARQLGITGTVDVRFFINTDGSTDRIRVIESEPGDVFDDSAVQAVSQWRFSPREEEVGARITLRFDLTP